MKSEKEKFIELDLVELGLMKRDILHSLNSYLLKRLHSLSQRTKNVLNRYLDFPLTYYSYHEKIVNNIGKFKKKKNIGESCVEEVELINEELRYLYKNLCNEDIGRIRADFLQFEFLCKRFYGLKSVDQSILEDFENHNFKFFRFFDYIISKVLPEHHFLILKNYSKFNFYKKSENHTMDALARVCGVTRQRVYQLTDDIEDKVRINLINFSYFFKYSYLRELKDRNIVVIDEELESRINVCEDVGFTVDFYAYAFDKILGSRFVLYGKDLRVSRSSGFIVKKETAKMFKIERFLAEIENRLGEKIRVSYSLELNEMLKMYISVLSDEHYKAVRELCSSIISECYSGMEIEGDSVVFQSNSKPKREDIIIGIIEKSGRPMTTDEIFEEYKIAAPESTMTALRGTLNNSKRIKYIRGGYGEGRLTYYATEKIILNQDISEGTAREIAYEYLEEQKQPCHIDDIYEYVKVKRPNLAKENLDKNLRLDSLNITVMPFGFLCLNKHYSGFELQKTYPKQLQIYGKAYIHKTNCSYGELLSYLCEKYDLEIKFVKLVFDRLITNGAIVSTGGTNEDSKLSLSEAEIERMQNMKRKFI